MPRFRLRVTLIVAATFALVAAACSNDSTPAASGAATSPGSVTACSTADATTNDTLAAICSSGKLRVATDRKYKPQSWFDVKTNQWMGFDIDVANEVSMRLTGQPASIEHQDWETVTAGSWNNRWDISVGSMTDTVPREKLFYFSPAYYYTPAALAVNTANTSITTPADASAKKNCVGVATTYQDYLQGDLQLGAGAPPFQYQVTDPQVVTFNTDTDALDQLALGDGVRCDAAISAAPTIQDYIKNGGAIKIVGSPLFYEPLSIAFDKRDPVDNQTLVDAVSKIVDEMHADGTLTALSMKWYGTDLTTSSAADGTSATPTASSS